MAIARPCLLALTGVLLAATPVYPQAVLLFDNGSADYSGGFEMTEWTVADDFQVTFSAEATRGTFAMMDSTCTFPANWDGHLRWWIYSDNGGVPWAQLATGFAPEVSASVIFDNCPDAMHFTVTFKLGKAVPLSSGVRYWLGLHMAADWSVHRDLYWGTTLPGNHSPGVASYGGSGPWGTVGLEHAFTLSAVGDDDYLFVDGFEAGATSLWSLTEP